MNNLKITSTNINTTRINFGESQIPMFKPDEYIALMRAPKNIREKIDEANKNYFDAIKNARQAFLDAVKKAKEELRQRIKELLKKDTNPKDEPQLPPTGDNNSEKKIIKVCTYSIPEVY